MRYDEIDIACSACDETGEDFVTDIDGCDRVVKCPVCNGFGRIVVPDGSVSTERFCR